MSGITCYITITLLHNHNIQLTHPKAIMSSTLAELQIVSKGNKVTD